MNRKVATVALALAVMGVWGCKDEEYEVLTGIDSVQQEVHEGRPLVLDEEEVAVAGADVSLRMVLVRAGTFNMGNGSATAPLHSVRLTHDFYMATTEVTQQLYEAVFAADSNPSHFNYGGDYPVESVSYGDALRFCQRLSAMTGYHFELPTEAQWEYAAYGGHLGARSPYAGSSLVDQVAWYNGNSPTVGYTGTSPYTGRDTLFSIHRTSAVALKSPNALGLYDMSGNVREWCADCWSVLSGDDATDPLCTTGGAERVYRGGACNDSAQYCQVANREGISSESRGFSIGFRVVINMR